MLETLAQAGVKEGHSYEPPLRAALVSLSLAALMSLEGATESVLARHETTLSKEQREAVTASLDNADVTVRRRALTLLAAGAGPDDVQTVCGQLFSHTSTADAFMRGWLLEQALSLIRRFPDSVTPDWQLSALVKLLPLAEEQHIQNTIMTSCQQLLHSDKLKADTRGKLLGVLEQHSKAKQAPTCLLILYVWTLGHFPELCQQDTGQEDAVARLISLGNKILHTSKQEAAELLLCVIQACSRACNCPSVNPTSELSEFLKQAQEVDADLEGAAAELLNTLPHLKQLREALASTPPTLDCTLSALDQFVAQHLRSGQCRAYQPHLAASLLQRRAKSPEARTRSPEVLTVQSPPQNVSSPASAPSEDSWSVRSISSPMEVVSPEVPVKALVWGRHGRNTSPEPPPAAATTLSIALSGNSQVTCSSTGPGEDPLGDLLR
ncbi:hypothetical protein B566_EDAN004197 [Ephemera danica]|nr:hypothetical protein B566_EDAN004197 [Ephemera danica]